MPKTTRIEIPAADSELIGLAVKIKDKHEKDGATSPITGLDWDTYAPKIDLAEQLEQQIAALNTQSEQLVQKRNALVDELGGFVRSSRDVLQGLNRPALRKLMDWGFSVNDTPKSARKTLVKTDTNK